MRILLDECVDPRVKGLLGEHDTATVHEQGWDSLKDGPLLELAQRQFEVLVTTDRSLEFQQNLAKYRIGVVVVRVPKNQIDYYIPIQGELLVAILAAVPGQVAHVPKASLPWSR